MNMTAIRSEMQAHYTAADTAVLGQLTKRFAPTAEQRKRIVDRATHLVDTVRSDTKPGITEAFLGEYGLSSEEGVAIMTLAEALLRIPDAETKDALIEDKTTGRAWMRHAGQSENHVVNASTLALSLTGQLMSDAEGTGVGAALRTATKRLGAPVIRTAVGRVMRELGHQFVLGETIQKATGRATAFEAKGYTYSYDMLGEAAMTAADAKAFFEAYLSAIHHIGRTSTGTNVATRAGISVKLSALHPRYEFLKGKVVVSEISDRLTTLCMQAARFNIGLNIDAEEADRLDPSLAIIDATLKRLPAGWDGFGVVVQAYGKRAGWVIDWLHALAVRENRKIMVRLVKGAYWDAEIKQAQIQGVSGFPVFSSKAATDVSYICCAAKLLGMRDRIYPQFATHNAHTVAAVVEMAGNTTGFEFQRLHGMGEALHDVNRQENNALCRIYAPVGTHKELLAYLVRRLLENGANSSFVNQIVDKGIPTIDVVADPFEQLGEGRVTNAALRQPVDLFMPERLNSAGLNLQNICDVEALEKDRAPYLQNCFTAHPLTVPNWHALGEENVINPADPTDVVGTVRSADGPTVDAAIAAAVPWAQIAPLAVRQETLNRVSELLEGNRPKFAALLSREAGKTLTDIDAELREAVDFLRFYAARAARHPRARPKGIVAAISPWNFPLAIFTGQVSAALATGNAVLAKPAEQTPLTAFLTVQLMHEAGVPMEALQLLPGYGADVGARLTSHPKVDAVCFTGSTATGHAINRTMAENLHPDASLLAETGGLNAMIVDSTALPEQAIKDIVASAFQSTGQRCSALRVLYIQDDIAAPFLDMLIGAMDELIVGDPLDRATDIGPVIDARAKANIEAHIAACKGRVLKQVAAPETGTFVGPTIIEIDGISDLQAEVFGPVLHVCRFGAGDIAKVITDINCSDYALTFGFHSRIESRAAEAAAAIRAGNVYVNRNQIGAVVGSQPFGGEGLSGTGPKAGGARYLTQFVKAEREVVAARTTAQLPQIGQAEIDNANARFKPRVVDQKALAGPTGESNILTTSGRGVVLCMGPGSLAERQALIASTMGSVGVIGTCDAARLGEFSGFTGVAYWGDTDTKRKIRTALAGRDGAILPLLTTADAMEHFVREQHVCVDTTAAGGNTALLAGRRE
ncbi:bifunctional proline dehydrogenase/L-glutamate gamma-semialdehyde dehydrogenase PutA [Actibacterium mucosum]|nr:bifunctional proline dehydrogenase/L-glutamate gamma-semialdehyde dehydrogenase PutA [Actibacterium mucosum]